MESGELEACLSEGAEVGRHRNPGQRLRQVICKALSVSGRMEDAVNVVENIILADRVVSVVHAECTQGRVGDVVDTLKTVGVFEKRELLIVWRLEPVSREALTLRNYFEIRHRIDH